MAERDMERMLRKAQLVEKRVAEARKALGKRIFEGQAEGLVEAAVNGDHEVLRVKIRPEAIRPEEAERLEKLVMDALNDALSKSKRAIDEEMRRATKGFSVPGL